MELSDRRTAPQANFSPLFSASGRDGGRGFQGGVTAGMRRPLGKFYQVLPERRCRWGETNQCQSPAAPAGSDFTAAAFLSCCSSESFLVRRSLAFFGPFWKSPSTWGSHFKGWCAPFLTHEWVSHVIHSTQSRWIKAEL